MPDEPHPDARFTVDLVTDQNPAPLLTRVVLPAIEDLEADPGFARVYFTRPEEDGARIRLHWTALDAGSSTELREAAEAALRCYGEDLDDDGQGKVSWRPGDDSMDADVFGGPVGLELCERQFELSSRAVLDAMDHVPQWNDEQVLGVALPLHLGFAAAAGFDRLQAAAFFTALTQRRYPDAPTVRQEMEEAFETTLEAQRAEIEPVVDLIWNTFSHDVALGEPWADRFYVSMRNLTDEMLQAHRAGRLDLPEERTWPEGDRLGTPCWHFGGLLFDQVHETDRRLGLGGADEIYLSHLLGELLQRD